MQQGSFTAGIGGGLWSRRHRRSGFARFSMTRFSLDKNQLENQAIHLTNVAVQKKQDNYDAESGGKWDLKPLKMSDPQLPVLFHGEPPWNNKALSPFATVVSRSVQCEECAPDLAIGAGVTWDTLLTGILELSDASSDEGPSM